MLLPLEKGRAGVEAPAFTVDIVYLQRTVDWADKGQARIDLPALDLPVSRTVVQLHYSPRFDVKRTPRRVPRRSRSRDVRRSLARRGAGVHHLR